MDISPEVRASHADLSPVALDFLDYLAADPAARAGAVPVPELPAWLREIAHDVQPWPTFVDAAKVAELERAAAVVTGLVKALPERLFAGDPARLARYCGFTDKRLKTYGNLRGERLAAFLFAPPNGLPGAIARCDFIDTATGLKCLEVNTGKIGGWQQRFFERHLRTTPTTSRFLAERGLRPVARDPWRELLRHVVGELRASPAGQQGEANVVFALDAEDDGRMRGTAAGFLDAAYQAVLAEHGGGLTGRAVFAPYPDGLTLDSGLQLHVGGMPVHAVVECLHELTPWPVYQSFKAGRSLLFSGPLHRFFGDKRNLALLSEQAHADVFTAEERALIAAYVPWTRLVAETTAVWRDEQAPLLDLLRRDRASFVLKPARGLQGQGVVVGERTAPEIWDRAVTVAAASGDFVAQELQVSRPHLCQHGEVGGIPHDVIWGVFCFGSRYGGSFLRQMPRGQGDGVINSERGAVQSFVFEV